MPKDFTVTITVDATAHEVFEAVRQADKWWNSSIKGDAATPGNTIIHEVPDIHYCKMTVSEVVPDSRIVWHVDENIFGFVTDQTEWVNTDIVFEIEPVDGQMKLRFTHIGLTSQDDCYELCSDAWGGFIRGSLQSLIATGTGSPIGGGNVDHERLVTQAKSGS